MFIAIVSCVLLACGFMYLYMRPMLERSMIEEKRSMVKNICEQEVSTLEEIETFARNVSFDDTIQNFFRSSTVKNSYTYFSKILALEKKLKEYKMLYGGLIRDICILDVDGNALETVHTYNQLIKLKEFKKFVDDDKSGYTSEFVLDYHGISGQKNTVAYVNTIYDKSKIHVKMGKIVILLEANKMTGHFSQNESIGVELYSPDETLVVHTMEKNQLNKKLYEDQIGENGWKIVYQINNEDVIKVMEQTTGLVLVVIVLILGCVLFITINLMKRALNPLETLIQGMQKVSDGSRKEHIEIHTGDECEEAAMVFNEMVERINQHTEKLIDSEKKQFESQLKMLSYQLNPHFIYNTLNAIICLARQNKSHDIIELTRAFIMLLQSLLRTDLQAMTTIENEQKYINNYIHVLQVCYQNVPNITWEVEEKLMKKQIPRMILYPLVENSVFHGIVPCDHLCYLKILIKEQEKKIDVTVEDNGIGCAEEELARIRERIGNGYAEKHIGLYNVNGRLQLIYGLCEPLQIDSAEEKGTKIKFSFYDKRV